MADFFDSLTFEFLAGLLVTLVVGFGAFIATLYRFVHKVSQDMFRLKKGFILYMELTKKFSKEAHPKSDVEYDRIIREMMTDDNGKI